MRHEIHSRTLHKTFHFWAPDRGGYIYEEDPAAGKVGTTGHQICNGGGHMGSTMMCTPESFVPKCQAWYRAHVRMMREVA